MHRAELRGETVVRSDLEHHAQGMPIELEP